jgi:hypothetical protein
MVIFRKIQILGVLGIVLISSCAVYPEKIGSEQETVIQHRRIEAPKKIEKQYTEQEIKEIAAAKDIVKKYWTSSYEDIYGLLSKKYQEWLKRNREISNATEYKNSMTPAERVWLKQIYQKAEIKRNDVIDIVVLPEWEEEGYEGVMTFIFVMVKEEGVWRIENIMF